MKIFLFYFGICCALLLAGCSSPLTSEELLNKSLKAHGGKEAWEAVKEIRYTKRTILYDSLEQIESDLTKTHWNGFSPEFTATMEWWEDSDSIKVVYTEAATQVYKNDSLLIDPILSEKYTKEILGAHYVYWMPSKLLDENAELQYDGLQTWPGERKVHKLQVSYPDAWDTWWYYFNPETFKLVGTEVYHEPTTSFIKNTKYETQTGLSLNAERTSYRVDSVGTIIFKRAEYYYTIAEILR